MKTKRSFRTISVLLLVFTIWLWNGQGWAQRPQSQGVNYKLVPNLEPINDSEPAPDFTLPSLSAGNPAPKVTLWDRLWGRSASPRRLAKKISLKDFRGRVVLLNFWASWCLPCREEMPAMELLYQEFKDQGFVLLAVNVKDKQKDALAFVKELKLTYPVLFDPEGEVGLLYGAWGLPTTYLIGRQGEGLARVWGPADWYNPGARRLIKELLDGKQ